MQLYDNNEYCLYCSFNLLGTCDVCQRPNRKVTTTAPELHPVPVKSPFYHIGINFIGPLSLIAEDGSQYVLTISDYFTKWIKAFLTPNKCASNVANVLFKVSVEES